MARILQLVICLFFSCFYLASCNKCLRTQVDPVHVDALDIKKLHLVVKSETSFTWQAARSGTTNITFWATPDIDVKTSVLSDGSLKLDSGSEFIRANLPLLLGASLVYTLLRPEHGGWVLFLLGLGHLTVGFAEDGSCPTSSALHVQIPAELVEELCVNGACQPLLCRLSTEGRYSSIPSNNRIIFTDNNCSIRLPDGWDTWWKEHFGNDTPSDPLGDYDKDELVNLLEFHGDDAFIDNFISVGGIDDPAVGARSKRAAVQKGTNPKKADSDLDLGPDGWERQYSSDPVVTNSLQIDSDSDGLTDFDELILDTDPRNADHDGDGETDGDEVKNGHNPRNPRSNGSGGGGGRTGPSNKHQSVKIRLTVGDFSSSESERYILNVHGREPMTPQISFQSLVWGRVDSKVETFFNGTYKVYIQHVDTLQDWLDKQTNADFDYQAEIEKVSGDPEVEIIDPDKILGKRAADHEAAEPLYAFGKEAEMKVKIKCKAVSGIENCIDKTFIKAREGFKTDGYVPKDKDNKPHANSGVTIGNGIDLKSKNRAYFANLQVSEALIKKLEPYMKSDLIGQAAQDFLDTNPLTLTPEEAKDLSGKVINSEVKRVEALYNNKINELDKGLMCFDMLTNDQRTVICSVLFQYGSPTRTPKFWTKVTQQDWSGAEAELRMFGDDFPTRRGLEANHLKADSGANSCD